MKQSSVKNTKLYIDDNGECIELGAFKELEVIEDGTAEIPEIAKEIQLSYDNSEQLEEIKESFIKLGKQLVEAVKPVKEALMSAWHGIKELLKVDPEIKKCYGIYKRTKKRKDQKKANDKNKKDNREEAYLK